MGDINHDSFNLSMESFRLGTFGENTLNETKNHLARAGFYYTHKGSKVMCFTCNLEFDASKISPNTDIVSLHKVKRPECRFISRF